MEYPKYVSSFDAGGLQIYGTSPNPLVFKASGQQTPFYTV
jgi:hypothetical protein